MGSSSAKPQALQLETQTDKVAQNPELWSKLKERQINQQGMMKLSQKINQPLDYIENAVKYLEKQGIIIENGLLGMGGSGIVLRACCEWNDHLAVKLMKYENLDQFQSNQREFDILKKFNSNYLTKVYQCLNEQINSINYQILVMERCVYDLKNYITKKISSTKLLTHSNLYSLCLQLSKGLQELHNKNILHLDIKPANILLGFDLKWKYADLGVSKVISENKQHTQRFIGCTVTYSSPEQYQFMISRNTLKVSKPSDIYSLGVVFLQLTGVDITQKWILKDKISPHNYDKYLNPYYEEFNNSIIKKMMQYEPDDRLTVEDLVKTLKMLKNQKNKPTDNLNQKQQENLNDHKKEEEQEDKHNKQQQNQLDPKKLKQQDQQEFDLQRDQAKILKVEKSKVKLQIKPISTFSQNQMLDSDEKVNKILEPTQSLLQSARVYPSQQQAFMNSRQNLKIQTKPFQRERISNHSSQASLLQTPTSNSSNLENKFVLKFPSIIQSQNNMGGQAQLSTKNSQKNALFPSLNDLNPFQSNSNLDKKSLSHLSSIDELKSPKSSSINSTNKSQLIKSKEKFQIQRRLVNIIQQPSFTKKQQIQQEYQSLQKQQENIFFLPEKQNYQFSPSQLRPFNTPLRFY